MCDPDLSGERADGKYDKVMNVNPNSYGMLVDEYT